MFRSSGPIQLRSIPVERNVLQFGVAGATFLISNSVSTVVLIFLLVLSIDKLHDIDILLYIIIIN